MDIPARVIVQPLIKCFICFDVWPYYQLDTVPIEKDLVCLICTLDCALYAVYKLRRHD